MYIQHPNITRKLLTGFMEFFNKIELERYTNSFGSRKIQKVPVQYCQTDKWIQQLNSASTNRVLDPELRTGTVEMQWSLPRISVNLINIVYDTERHLNKTKIIQQIKQDTTGKIKFVRMPVPYNLEIELATITKNLDDSFQIMEQIIPFFSPSLSLDIHIIDSDTPESIPVSLNTVNFDFPTEVAATEERLYTVTYGMTMRANYYFAKDYMNPVETAIINIQTENGAIPIDSTDTLFSSYVNNALTPTVNPTFDYPKDTDSVTLIKKGTWSVNGNYKNYEMVELDGNKYIWIGGNKPNVKPGTSGWHEVWTLQTVLQNMNINFEFC